MSQGYPQQQWPGQNGPFPGQPFQTPFDQQPQQQWGNQQAPQAEADYDWNGFDPEEYPDDRAPDGTFGFVITDAKTKATKNGSGLYLSITCELHTGQNCWPRFTLKNDNEMAVRIGKTELAKLLRAIGLKHLAKGPGELIGKRGTVTISHRIDKRGQEQENFRFVPAAAQAAGAPPLPAPAPHQPQQFAQPPVGPVPMAQPPQGVFHQQPQRQPQQQPPRQQAPWSPPPQPDQPPF